MQQDLAIKIPLKCLISLIVDFVDPLEMKGPQPTMSADFRKAMGAIEKRA